MPPAVQPDIADTTLPGATRRRVWAAPEVRSHSLLVLSLTKLFVTPDSGPPKPETVSALERGMDVESLLGPAAMTVDLFAIQRLRLDLASNTLAIDYHVGRGTPTRHRIAVVFATSEAADTVFTKLWRRLGQGFELTPLKSDWIEVVRTPVAALLGVAAATAAIALGLSALPDAAPGALALPVWFDWRVVCGLGGAALALVQVWLYRRFTLPPARLELVRR